MFLSPGVYLQFFRLWFYKINTNFFYLSAALWSGKCKQWTVLTSYCWIIDYIIFVFLLLLSSRILGLQTTTNLLSIFMTLTPRSPQRTQNPTTTQASAILTRPMWAWRASRPRRKRAWGIKEEEGGVSWPKNQDCQRYKLQKSQVREKYLHLLLYYYDN